MAALLIEHTDDPTLTFYSGRTHSKDEYDTMVSNVPSVTSETTNGSVSRPLDGGTLEQFKQKMEAMIELNKKQSKAAKEKKMKGRVAKQKTLSDQFKRAQRYLGLRPCAKDGEYPRHQFMELLTLEQACKLLRLLASMNPC